MHFFMVREKHYALKFCDVLQLVHNHLERSFVWDIALGEPSLKFYRQNGGR